MDRPVLKSFLFSKYFSNFFLCYSLINGIKEREENSVFLEWQLRNSKNKYHLFNRVKIERYSRILTGQSIFPPTVLVMNALFIFTIPFYYFRVTSRRITYLTTVNLIFPLNRKRRMWRGVLRGLDWTQGWDGWRGRNEMGETGKV